jgi:predicted secreted protein
LANTAELEPLDFNTDGVADGNGIVMWINGEIFFMEMDALPAAGTEWQLRAVAGNFGATCTPALGPAMTDCTDYTFAPNPYRGTVVPGLRYNITVEQTYGIDLTTAGDLTRVHTVPDPYYVTSGLEVTPTQKVIKFVNLPAQAMIRIYSLSGVLVDVLEHNDPGLGGEETWNVRNRNQQFVASGVYFFHVETPSGQEKIGRFTVVNASGLAVGAGIQ